MGTFKEFMKVYISEDIRGYKLQDEIINKEKSYENKNMIFFNSKGSRMDIFDIKPLKYNNAEICVLNIQDELTENSEDDFLINCLISDGIRVIFTRQSDYSQINNDINFYNEGMNYWKPNIISQIICMDYIKAKAYNKLNVISANGFCGCSLVALKYHNLKCNSVFLLNGLIDFIYMISNDTPNNFFRHGYYADFNKNDLLEDDIIKNMNPAKLLSDIRADKKCCMMNDVNLPNENNFLIKPYNNIKDFINLVLQDEI